MEGEGEGREVNTGQNKAVIVLSNGSLAGQTPGHNY